jgi:hypothetical protein
LQTSWPGWSYEGDLAPFGLDSEVLVRLAAIH